MAHFTSVLLTAAMTTSAARGAVRDLSQLKGKG